MKKAVIIGAGQTGRGFIAPIVQENGYAITFLDKDHALVEQLRKEKEYTVSYFGGKREPQHISGYSALTTDEIPNINKTKTNKKNDFLKTYISILNLKRL